MTFTLSKWGLESPSRLLKVWNSIARVKTPRLEVFFVSLESSQGELQVCLGHHHNRRSEKGVVSCQSPGGPNRDSFGTPPWESREKMTLGCRCGGVTQRILYGGRWWLPPSMGRGEFCESKVTRGLS
jgi:hypothetical protein